MPITKTKLPKEIFRILEILRFLFNVLIYTLFSIFKCYLDDFVGIHVKKIKKIA